MKKNKKLAYDEMLPEYDFSKGVRGKYANLIKRSQNYVILEPDIAKKFKSSQVVNNVLRLFLDVQNQLTKKTKQITS
ncbi:MAG: hypothetical protein HQM15_04375 [Deltaproteobacteria bacterium]|nr:hypothetical protein [Deltaproteobacteria bacterium]